MVHFLVELAQDMEVVRIRGEGVDDLHGVLDRSLPAVPRPSQHFLELRVDESPDTALNSCVERLAKDLPLLHEIIEHSLLDTADGSPGGGQIISQSLRLRLELRRQSLSTP